MAPLSDISCSIKPPNVPDKRPKNIGEFIARITKDKGSFRNISEASLREAIATNAYGPGSGGSNADAAAPVVRDEAEEESDSDSGDEDRPKDAVSAKAFMQKNLQLALNSSLHALDLVSLLLTKDSPGLASQSLSPMLRDLVGIGTLGAGKITLPGDDEIDYDDPESRPAFLTERQIDDETVAAGLVLSDIATARDSVAAVADALAAEVAREARYWVDVMNVRCAGWDLVKMTSERSGLGVRFGFREAAAEFRAGSLAPLRRGDDGAARLDCSGRFGAGSGRLLVTIERHGVVTGRSDVGPTTWDSPLLYEKVREARNTIFAQELWHEIVREANLIHGYDVRVEPMRVTARFEDEPKIHIELVVPGREPYWLTMPAEAITPADAGLAAKVHLSLHLLLAHAHRDNETRRTKPLPEHIPRTRPPGATYPLLRPVIDQIVHRQVMAKLVGFLRTLVAALRTAGVPGAGFVVRNSSVATRSANRAVTVSGLVQHFLMPLNCGIEVTLTPESRVWIFGRTQIHSQFHVKLLLPSPAASPVFAYNPLQQSCPPYHEPYPSLKSVFDYLRQAASRAIIDHCYYLEVLPYCQHQQAKELHKDPHVKVEAGAVAAYSPDPDEPLWAKSFTGTSLWDQTREEREIEFAVEGREGNEDPDEVIRVLVYEQWKSKPSDKAMRKTRVFEWDSNGRGGDGTVGTVVMDLVREEF